MDIGLVYCEKDPKQAQARDFVRRFVRERGMQAIVSEERRNVKSPTLVIDGHTLTERRRRARPDCPAMFPAIKDIAAALEQHLWCL